jgi:tetratricopeptide (TPR) repeat protein
MTNNDLMLGIAAAKAGKISEAQTCLIQYVRANPDSEEGWLWLGHCVSDPKRREYCYQKTLSINPNNGTARRALLALTLSAQPAQAPVEVRPPEHVSPFTEAGPEHVSPFTEPIPQARPVARPLPAPEPARKPPQKPAVPQKKANIPLLIGVSVTVVLLFTIPLAIYLIGNSNRTMAQIFPFAFPSPTPRITLTPRPRPTYVPATLNPTTVARNNQVRVDALRDEASGFMEQSQFQQAIAVWDKIINQAPGNDADYVHRANSEYAITLQPISRTDIQHYLELAVADLDKAIALNPDRIEYYGLRHQALSHMGDMQELTANRLYLYGQAYQDLQVVLTRGHDPDADDNLATLLVYSGRCEEGLKKLAEISITATPEQKARYHYLQSVGYACLGQPARALTALDQAEVNGVTQNSMALRSDYLYMAGRSKEALANIDKFIKLVPDYGGERYYLRALIYYQMGDKTQAEQDLAIGQRMAYTEGQVLAYVQAKLALDKGNKEEAIKYLQLAEATLDVVYNPLRWRVQKELLALGAQPLQMTPSVLLTRTPTP